MIEFEAAGSRYRARVLCAAEQWAMLSVLRTVLPALAGMDYGFRVEGAAIEDITSALSPLLEAPDDDVTAVFAMARAASDRHEAGEWRPIAAPPPLPVLMRMTTEVVAANFSALFALTRASFRPVIIDRPMFEPVTMPDGEDWLWRPVLRGLCRAESLYDGTLRIEHIAKMNDAIDVETENQARMQKAAERK